MTFFSRDIEQIPKLKALFWCEFFIGVNALKYTLGASNSVCAWIAIYIISSVWILFQLDWIIIEDLKCLITEQQTQVSKNGLMLMSRQSSKGPTKIGQPNKRVSKAFIFVILLHKKMLKNKWKGPKNLQYQRKIFDD